MRNLRVNETKVTSRKAFTVNLFASESKQKSKNKKMTFFADFSQIPDLSVSPLASNATFVWFLRLS